MKQRMTTKEREALVRARARRKPPAIEAAPAEVYDRASTVTIGFAKKAISVPRVAFQERAE